uniref:CemA protein n=1 Tax=Fopius arisanus TaxID=64838 RepID=A0A0C9PHQ7_9HYME
MSGSKCVKPPRKAYTKEPNEMTHQEKLKLIDEELNSFYKYCQQAGFTEEEMDIICQPLVAAMRRSWLQLVLRATVILVVIGTVACAAAQLDFVGTHLSAITRVLAVKILPFWNWQYLYRENCMMNNPFYNEYPITEEDCVTCEAVETIDRLSDVHYRHLVDNYLNRDAPAIITDAMDSWGVMNTDHFWFDNITHVRHP